MQGEFATKNEVVVLYSYDVDTKEYLNSFEYLWVKDTGLAANSVLIKPEVVEGLVPVWSGVAWDNLPDHRGASEYCTKTKVKSVVDYVGEIKDGFTLKQPTTNYDTWIGGEWVDERTKQQKVSDKTLELKNLNRKQFKLMLLDNDLLGLVPLKINEIPDYNIQQRVKIEYEEAIYFERTNPSVVILLELLGLSEQQINEMWEIAGTL